MFYKASSFNRDLSNWDVSRVTDMRGMFREAHSFNGDLRNWDVSRVTNMEGMFYRANRFNPNNAPWCRKGSDDPRLSCFTSRYG